MNEPIVGLPVDFQPSDTVTTAADLGRRDAERMPKHYALDADKALVVARVRTDETLQTLSLEQFLDAPLNPRGAAVVHDPSDFASYVRRLADDRRTTLWADLQAGSVAAVLDDHTDADTAGWREHSVRLQMQEDVDWKTWLHFNGELREQHLFAEHIEGMSHTIVEPSAADMLEMITSFHAKRNVKFRQQISLTSGDLQLTYDEETKGTAGTSGQIEVPRTFTIRISPWVTVDPVDVIARLRWRIQEGQLRIGYSLLRADRAKAVAFDGVLATIGDGINGLPLYLGSRPAQVTPRTN